MLELLPQEVLQAWNGNGRRRAPPAACSKAPGTLP